MKRSVAMRMTLIFLLVAAWAHGGTPASPGTDAKALTAYEEFVTSWLSENKVPGVTIGFFKDGQVWVKSFGLADLENGTPARVDSAYRFASVQKSMTAVAVLQLAEQGKLDLDADIRTYVPYFPDRGQRITARLLLGHLGGIPHYVNREVEQHITTHKTTREAIKIFEQFGLVAEPGSKYSYSSYGYNLLGAAIEGAAKQPYGKYMQDHVWVPAGMLQTRMDDPLDLIPNRVRGYQRVNGEVKNSEFIDVSSRFAAGGTRGTVGDLLRFMIALNDGKLLTPASRTLMYTPMTTLDGQPVPYAMGWQIPPFENRGALVTNDGGQQETRTFILNDPEHRFGMALAMNLEADIYGPLVMRLYETLNGTPLKIRR